jgi:GTPase
MANVIAIVGRPNVGKSTLFNRLVEERKAIMDNQPGVTRDRHYGYGEWNGKHFTVIDTGGYVSGSDDIFEEEIRKQVKLAIEEANVIVFVVDTFEGLTGLDQEFANELRGTKKPILIAANKTDNTERLHMIGEFYGLNIGDVFPIASISGSGTGELLDEAVKHFEDDGIEDPEEGIPRIAVLGKPNVGKSSFLNALLGTERSIVTELAGTTRDSIESRYKLFGQDFILVDTAGIRKKKKVKEDIEFYSVLRSMKAMESADVCIVMIDGSVGIEAQDLTIIQQVIKHRRGIILMVNKWDLVEKDHKTMDNMKKEIMDKLGIYAYVPVIFTSVLTKQRIFQAVELVAEVYKNKSTKIPTSKLNEVMLKEIERYPPPAYKGKYIRIKYITQLPTKSPTFAFFCNLPQYIKEPYERYLENRLRDHFDLKGVPLALVFRQK